MKEQYSKAGNNMEAHIANIELKPSDNDYKKGFIISSGNDDIAVYNEFGTGIVGKENPNPLAGKSNYEYNVPSPHKGEPPEMVKYSYTQEYLDAVNTPNTWWYFKNGKWWHTEGMKGKQMYSSLVDELRENAPKEFAVYINQTLGNNGGK